MMQEKENRLRIPRKLHSICNQIRQAYKNFEKQGHGNVTITVVISSGDTRTTIIEELSGDRSIDLAA